MHPHPLKAFLIPILAALSLTLLNAAALNAYTYNTENKTDYNSDYSTNKNTENKTRHNTDYNADYSTEYNESEPQHDTEQNAPVITTPAKEPIGPAAFFDKILRALSKKSDSQNDRIKELRAAVPDILPDLYNVYLIL